MKFKLKIFAITIFILIFSFSYVQAIDMFLTNNGININSSEIISDNIIESEEPSEEFSQMDSGDITSVTNPAPTVTHTSSTSESTLSISDVIDIILISVCVVLIFLGIAILIRCK